MIDFAQFKTFLYLANTCKQKRFIVNAVHLLNKVAESYIMPGTNQQIHDCNTSRKYTRISIFKVPKAKSGMPELKDGRITYEDLFFFFHETML